MLMRSGQRMEIFATFSKIHPYLAELRAASGEGDVRLVEKSVLSCVFDLDLRIVYGTQEFGRLMIEFRRVSVIAVGLPASAGLAVVLARRLRSLLIAGAGLAFTPLWRDGPSSRVPG
jgi:hypothetical protein